MSHVKACHLGITSRCFERVICSRGLVSYNRLRMRVRFTISLETVWCPDSLFTCNSFWASLCILGCTSSFGEIATSEDVWFSFLLERVIQQNLCFPSSPDTLCMRQLIYCTCFHLKLIMLHTVKSGVTSSFCSESSLLFLWCFRYILVHRLSCRSCGFVVWCSLRLQSLLSSQKQSLWGNSVIWGFLLVLQSLLQLGEMFFFGMTTPLTNG